MNAAELRSRAAASGLVPLYYEPDAERAIDAMHALARGGATLIEFTLRGPGAERVLARLVDAAPAGAAVGAGSAATPELAELALAAGAAFVVAPNGDRDVAAACAAAGVAYVPGCLTPSEIVAARRSGAAVVKVFPVAAVGGPTYVRAIRGPLPDVDLMATGGVGLEDARSYLDAGALCVGMGGELVRRDWLRAGRMDELAAATQALLAALGRAPRAAG